MQGPVSVYVSLPLSGPAAADGTDAADGARLALEQARGRAGELEVRARFLDDAADGRRWDPAAVGRNARAAASDSSTAAYIGELDSEPTRASAPITNEAGIAQVSPAAGGVDLTRPAEGYPNSPERYRPAGDASFARVVPADDVVAAGAAALAGELGGATAAVPGPGPAGELAAAEFTSAAEAAGVEVVAPGADLSNLFYGGTATGSEALAGVAERASPDALIATDALGVSLAGIETGGERLFLAAALAPRNLPAASFAREFERRFGRAPGPYAAYGYEAMALVLQAIAEAEGNAEFRPAVREAIFGADRRESVLGRYSIDQSGDTTLCAVQRYRLEGGEPVAEGAPCVRG